MLIPAKNTFIAGISALLILATTGCISSGGNETSSANTTSNANPHPDCSPRALTAHPDPEVEKFALSLSLGRDISIEAAQVIPATTHPGKLVLSITVCVPHSSDSDSLRPVASDIAHELIKTELGKKTYSFSVRDQSVQGGIETILRVKDFSDRPWDGSPSIEAELNSWEVFPS
ncbi:hypothetical protein NLM24_25600 [Nocardia zapadnayensis]|uniref:hypothetical protein n=1 Tax=Nocardia rhamnosiphila TaxID=426716 RepID=UPI00224868EE|nr:hypothetical protein [Nocardia zapadnayensis]MCX0274006.1 hypothetical protein [Nocardia zapadnayensis]